MAYITVKQFAEKHNVTRQAITAAIKAKTLKSTERFGITVISENAEYDPVRGRGKKPSKKKGRKKIMKADIVSNTLKA